MKRFRILSTVGLALIVSSVLAAAATAGGSTSVNGYAGVAGTIQSSVKHSGTLPFTGLDLGLVAGVALAALFAGVMMRRSARS